MERRKPLKRGGPLKRKTALKSGSKLASKTRLKTKVKTMSEDEKRAKLKFVFETIAPNTCAVCWRRGEVCEGQLQAHHVIYEQHLRAAGLDHVVWDSMNGLCICERAHRRHHSRHQPIERSLLRADNIAFAEQHDLMRLIEKFYPPR